MRSDTIDSPDDRRARHLYVHIPFCDGKCDYCAFYSVACDEALADRVVDAVLRELRLLGLRGSAPTTLYLGGGSPSVLGPDRLGRLCRGLREALALPDGVEWSVEVNPRSVTPQMPRALAGAGVNRVSIGAQSFDEQELEKANRRHAAAAIEAAVHAFRAAGIHNVGLDLIAGLPGQTEASWAHTLQRALALPLQHLSVYALALEAGTPFAARYAGAPPCPDDAVLQRLSHAEAVLNVAGFERYEISNYARPGFACGHNLGYWLGCDFVGLGPGASSRIGCVRRNNAPNVEAYAAALESQQAAPASIERRSAFDDAEERALYALRSARGLDVAEAVRRWPQLAEVQTQWQSALREMASHGWVACEDVAGGGRRPAGRGDAPGLENRAAGGGTCGCGPLPAGRRWRLTACGREVADAVMRELVSA